MVSNTECTAKASSSTTADRPVTHSMDTAKHIHRGLPVG